jgi:DNA-binding LacI/PurR family transcriptional regulator
VCDDVNASKVVVDDYQSAFNAVSYLAEKGYKRIAHLAGPNALGICRNRLQGYMDALKQHGLSVQDEFVRPGGLHEQNGYDSMEALIKEKKNPDALFAVNDPVAVGAFQRAKEEGLRIPQDIAVLGFSNNKITSLVDPPITTIDQPSYEMGKKAAEIMIETIEKRLTEPQTIVLDTKLIVRGST